MKRFVSKLDISVSCRSSGRKPSEERKVLFMERTTQERQLDIQRAYNRKYAATYRRNSPEKRRANNLRYYVRQLIAAGYTVTEPAASSRAAV